MINETKLSMSGARIHIVDVSRLVGEQRIWMGCFDGVPCLIVYASMCNYCKVCSFVEPRSFPAYTA